MEGVDLDEIEPGVYETTVLFPDVQLLSGEYHFNVATTDQENVQAYDAIEAAEPFAIIDSQQDYGVCRLQHRWIAGRPTNLD
jgi:hypothetical protein